MNIILTENVEGLGKIGDLVKVKPGYARNYLVPRSLAVEANTRNVKELEHQKRQMERKLQKLTQEAEVLKARIEKVSCVFAHRAGEEGKLFGSVTSMDIGAKLAEAGIEIDRKKIQLDEPIKALGDYRGAGQAPGRGRGRRSRFRCRRRIIDLHRTGDRSFLQPATGVLAPVALPVPWIIAWPRPPIVFPRRAWKGRCPCSAGSCWKTRP